MAEGFKGRIENAFRSVGKEQVSEEKAKDLDAVRRQVSEETWEEIVHMQEGKRDLVLSLKQWRKKFWQESGGAGEKEFESFDKDEGARTLIMKDGVFGTPLKGGEIIPLTHGEVFAAAEWGFWWKLGEGVSPEMQREVMTHQVREVMAKRFDDQLIALGKENKLSDDRMRDTYSRKGGTEQALENMPDGIIAEKMLMSFLTKEMHDGDLPFKVLKVDVYEDIEHKIDFIVTVEGVANRFVNVAEPKHRIGIQFTLNAFAKTKKTEQLKRAMKLHDHGEVDELVLVTVPIEQVRATFDAWRYDEKNVRRHDKKIDPRGPDHAWSEETKQQIIDGLIQGIGLESAPTVRKAA